MTTTTEATTYNGWTNYATWRVNLELIDDKINWLVEDINGESLDPFASVIELADNLKEYAEYAVDPEDADTLAHQYANAFLADVNWYEIAKTAADDNPELVAPVCSDCGDQLERHEIEHNHGYCDACEATNK